MQLRIASLFVLAITACTSSPEQGSLEQAQARWSGESLDDYQFTWRQSCECTTATTRPIHIRVVDDVISGATYVDDGSDVPTDVRQHLKTIKGIFATIQEAIDEGAYRITVSYDPQLGYPTSVAVDYQQQVADEELSLEIRDVQQLTR